MFGGVNLSASQCPSLSNTRLNDTGLLVAEQSEFHKNHSTQTSLHKLIENFHSDIQNGKIIGMLM